MTDMDRALTLAARSSYLLGLDLGQSHDYTAWVGAWRVDRSSARAAYDVDHIDRVRGARYPDVVTHTRRLVDRLRAREPRPRVALVVDYTGVGRPVADMLMEADLAVSELVLVTITGGDQVTTGDRGERRVPKRELASVVQRVLQDQRLRFSEGLHHTRTLTEELMNFRVKISASGHDSYGAGLEWRENNHDDLVLALALAGWWGEKQAVGALGV